MTHCLPNWHTVTSEIKWILKYWLSYLSNPLCDLTQIHEYWTTWQKDFFSPTGQRDTISQAAVKGRALSHPFPRWWHYRHIHKLLRQEVSVKDYWASSSPQKTASKWRALNKLCLRLQPTFKGATELVCTRVKFLSVQTSGSREMRFWRQRLVYTKSLNQR